MIRKVLIANRGEIACRILRTCRDLGIATVAVFSDADAHALHVELADEAVAVGPAPTPQSYLDGAKLIDAARRTGADAVHPGYGFLSERAEFAQAVLDAGLTWIGPTPANIEAMGDKRKAKRLLHAVPLVPGYTGDDQTDATLLDEAARIGYPVMVKAAAGGGGKGMRVVTTGDEMADALAAARREATQAFGDGTLMLEKYIVNPRHVEVQIFGDTHGTVIALGERECSIQRRHQKIIEESPSPALDDALRTRMLAAAVSIGQQIGYVNAGTVEFILDADRNFYFLEMNTRLQVEHPVTEMVTGVDLVRWQIEVAQGGYLPPQTSTYGHAVEVRLYAEDPANGFLPATGDILRWRGPDKPFMQNESETWTSARVDTGIRSGDRVTVYYDPMIAKIIAHGETRQDAIRRLDYALAQTQLLGLRSNLAFLRRILAHPEFVAGDIDTGFIDRHPELLPDSTTLPPLMLIAAALAKEGADAPPARSTDGGGGALLVGGRWRNNPYRPIKHTFKVEGAAHEIALTPAGTGSPDAYTVTIGDASHTVRRVSSAVDGDLVIEIDGHRQKVTVLEGADDLWWVHTSGGVRALEWVSPLPSRQRARESESSLRAPMPGQVILVNITHGQFVRQGDILLVIEAMKMEHRIKAPYDGRVSAIHYGVGQSVQMGEVLLDLHPEEAPP